MIGLLGGQTESLRLDGRQPSIIMLTGLQGLSLAARQGLALRGHPEFVSKGDTEVF